MKRARLRHARNTARRLLVDLGVREPEHIDPIETAQELGIEIAFGKLERATARVYRIGSRARIRVSDAIVHPGRRRFSIAHEIGHVVLGHELPRDPSEPALQPIADEGHEREADAFAAEHLTPEDMVRPYCQANPVSFEAVHKITERFTVSPMASAIRFVELTSACCAVAYSESGMVRWATRSASFPWRVPGGMTVRPETVAASHFRGEEVTRDPRAVPWTAWLPYARAPVPEVIEHIEPVVDPDRGGIMSLLWVPNAGAHDRARGST